MRRKQLSFALHLLFWMFTSWLIISSFSITEHMVNIDEGIISDSIVRSDDLIWFFSIGQPFFAFYFYVQIFLTKKLASQKKIYKLLWQSMALIGAFYSIYISIVYFLFSEYVHILWFPSLWFGVFAFYIIIAISYGFIHTWIHTEKDKQQLEIINKQNELNLLRAQLHPHFLFNTMNNLLAMVDQEQHPKLALTIDRLSSLLRYVVYENQQAKVSIAKEIQFIRDFAELHLIRFEEDEIDFKLHIFGEFDQQLIEMSLLLCFVENAFKHGVQPEVCSYIHIDVDISKAKRMLFSIKNSIHPVIATNTTGGYGLQATTERLQLAYPNKHQLNISQSKDVYELTLILNT